MLQEDKYNLSRLGKVSVRLLLMLTNKLLYEKLNSLRLLRFENNSKSNIILRLFDERSRVKRFTSLDIELGIEPCRLFDERDRSVRFTSLDIELGIEPCRLFDERDS